jgi:predicted nucleic acid-binding protein
VQVVPEGEAPPLPRCKDRDDQKFLELAARCDANMLVSKDKALLTAARPDEAGFSDSETEAASALLQS